MHDLVRLLGVGWVGVLSFVFAYLVSVSLDYITPELDKSKPKWATFMEVALQFGIVGIIVFMARGFIKKIPFPLEGAAGYIHSQLGELRSLPLLVFIFMFFQRKTQDKMRFLMHIKPLPLY
jgi:hypothetical protein